MGDSAYLVSFGPKPPPSCPLDGRHVGLVHPMAGFLRRLPKPGAGPLVRRMTQPNPTRPFPGDAGTFAVWPRVLWATGARNFGSASLGAGRSSLRHIGKEPLRNIGLWFSKTRRLTRVTPLVARDCLNRPGGNP